MKSLYQLFAVIASALFLSTLGTLWAVPSHGADLKPGSFSIYQSTGPQGETVLLTNDATLLSVMITSAAAGAFIVYDSSATTSSSKPIAANIDTTSSLVELPYGRLLKFGITYIQTGNATVVMKYIKR